MTTQSILQSLHGSLRLPDGFLCDVSFLIIKSIYFLNFGSIILSLPICLISRLEGLDLTDRLISVLVNLIDSLNHAGKVSSLDSKLFLQFDVDLFKNYSLASQLIYFVSDLLILDHGLVEALVCFVKSVLDNLDLPAQLALSVPAGSALTTSSRSGLLAFRLNDLLLEVLDFFI